MTLEVLGHQVTREYLHDGRIAVYSIIGGGQDISDSWADAIIAEITAWGVSRPYLTLQDMSQSGISPYGKKRTDDILRSIPPDMQVYIAIVLGHSLFSNFIRLFIKSLAQAHKTSHISYHFTSSRAEALAWLEQYLEKP